jgi:hypothetical protein
MTLLNPIVVNPETAEEDLAAEPDGDLAAGAGDDLATGVAGDLAAGVGDDLIAGVGGNLAAGTEVDLGAGAGGDLAIGALAGRAWRGGLVFGLFKIGVPVVWNLVI